MTPLLSPATGSGAPAELGLLVDLFKLFGLAIFVVWCCDRLRIPSIVGFVLTGVLAGPNAFGLVRDVGTVELLANIGVILLLFCTGIEFSFKTLLQLKTAFIGGGSLQVALTLGAGVTVALITGFPSNQAVFVGFLVALSCTAIAIKLLQQRAELDSAHGRLSVGIVIFQDFTVVPMVLLLPLLAGTGGAALSVGALAIAFVKAVCLLVLVVISARYAIPWIFYRVSLLPEREVFLLTVIFVGLLVAYLSSLAGLSLALGAFLAGLIISESEYSQRALGSILPFKEVFISLFFISVGMLLNPGLIVAEPLLIASLAALLLVGKIVTATAAVLLLGYPLRIALMTAFTICGIGEFAFVLAKDGLKAGLITEHHFQIFLAISVVSLVLCPLILSMGSRLLPKLAGSDLMLPVNTKDRVDDHSAEKLEDHLIIIGFGPTGRAVAAAAKAADISYIVLELNPLTVNTERAKGEPIFHGDASQSNVLEHLGIARCRVLLVVIADPAAGKRIVAAARCLNPTLRILVRTRFINEMPAILKEGASEVIPEELESAVELLSRVLRAYMLPSDVIDQFVDRIRADGYQMLRKPGGQKSTSLRELIPSVQVSVLRVADKAHLAGKTLGELQMRSRYGVTVLAIRRGEQTIDNPRVDLPLEMDDELVVLGVPAQLTGMVRKLSPADMIPGV